MIRARIAPALRIAVFAGTVMLGWHCGRSVDGVSDVAVASAPATDTARQALAIINHLVPRPDSVGPQPAKFALTPIAGADSYAIGLVSEIDSMVWQTQGLAKAEVDWPSSLEVPVGTYFWMVEGYRDGRRMAESGRAAFVVER